MPSLFEPSQFAVLSVKKTPPKLKVNFKHMNKGAKFLKKLWCCVGARYTKVICLLLTATVMSF